MSYWVYLNDAKGESVSVERHSEGGTYCVGGIDEAELNVTYNYGEHFRNAWREVGGTFDGEGDGTLGEMIGTKRAGDVLPFLEGAVALLGTERAVDYWASTEGNAGYALGILRDWARQHPDATFEVH